MKKFKFTLQSVHQVREMREENEQMELSRLKNDERLAAEKIAQIDQLRQEAIRQYGAKLESGKPVNAYELEMNFNHISNLDRLRQQAVETLEQKKLACQRQSSAVAAANRAVKITSRLRETQEKRHKSEADRHEQNAVDELVSANFARRMTK